MRIVFVLPRPMSLVFGGSEVQALRTREQLQALGHTVEFLDLTSRDQLRQADVVHLFGSDFVFGQLSEMLAAAGIPYVVSSIFYPVGAEAWGNAALSRLPRSQFWHRRLVLARAARILPNSRSEVHRLRGMYRLPAGQFTVIPNGVNPGDVGHDPEDFRREFLPGLAPDEPFVLSVGRIERRKNSLNLLRAARLAGLPAVFVGQATETHADYAAAFQAEAAGRPDVHLIGPLPSGGPQLANAYAAARVHALVSVLETPGLASLEAGLNGANLVLGECAPVRDYFAGLGFFAPPQDVAAIAAALREAARSPRNVHGQAEAIAARYSWQQAARQTAAVYAQVARRA